MREFAEYLLELAATPLGPIILMIHGYLESFILPVAHDLFLVAVSLGKPENSFLYAAMSTTVSVLGIMTGYVIGVYGGKPLLVKLINPRLIIQAKKKIHKHDFWAIAIACFTPIPVKVFAIIAGIVHLNFRKLVVVSIMARGLRFFMIGTLIYFYGETIREWVLSYMGWTMSLIFISMLVGAFFWKRIKRTMVKKEPYG